jgi:hypothetical protein
MRRSFLGIVFCAGVYAAPAAKEVTFHKDVEPLLQAHCQTCHRPGEAAPMSLLTYDDARKWSAAIKEAVKLRKMPPWFADPAHGQFSNDRRLSQEQIDTITQWADSGKKEGSPKDAPKPLTFSEGWVIGKPDAVVEMPNAFEVPAKGTVDYAYIVVPTGFTEDKWIERVEVRPGDRSVVHHIVMLVRPPGVKYMTDAKPGIPYFPPRDEDEGKHRPDTGKGQFQFTNTLEMIGVYVPGGLPYEVRPGQARFIPKGSDVIFQMHYTANGKVSKDQSRIGFVFAKEAPKERVVNTFVSNVNLHIPPMAADHAVSAKVTLQADATVQSFFPHMHVRGKGFEYKVTYPSGETETLLNVPNYNFNWQLTYFLKQPKLLPKGTVIECVARFDNSPNNPFNPDPKSDVYWGEQTWEEMLAGFIDFAMPVNVTMREIAVPKRPAPSAGGNE